MRNFLMVGCLMLFVAVGAYAQKDKTTVPLKNGPNNLSFPAQLQQSQVEMVPVDPNANNVALVKQEGDDNQNSQTQTGNKNTSLVLQSNDRGNAAIYGKNNVSSTTQTGNYNTARVNQRGGTANDAQNELYGGNTAEVQQESLSTTTAGNGNQADISQGVGYAEGNVARTSQKGEGNKALQFQRWDNNEAIIEQEGNNNQAVQKQYSGRDKVADANYSKITQDGAANHGENHGRDNLAKVIQYGANPQADIDQSGSENYAEILQGRSGRENNTTGNRASIIQGATNSQGNSLGSRTSSTRGWAERNEAFIDQLTNDNTADIEQYWDDNYAEITQKGGNGNTAEIDQSGIETLGNATSDQMRNRAYIDQDGAGNWAKQSQGADGSGYANFAYIDQSGTSNYNYANQAQTGTHNDAQIEQIGVSYNAALQTQEGNYNSALIQQKSSGSGNGMTVMPPWPAEGTPTSNTRTINYANQSQTGGDWNEATVLQDGGNGNWSNQVQMGSSNDSFVNQFGNNNSSDTFQSGAFNVTNVNQTGNGNISNVSQTGGGQQ